MGQRNKAVDSQACPWNSMRELRHGKGKNVGTALRPSVLLAASNTKEPVVSVPLSRGDGSCAENETDAAESR